MVEVVWTEPALGDLDAIADYIALDNVEAARALVQRLFKHVDQLQSHPQSGSRVPEISGARYRQIVEPPCRVLYRYDGKGVCVVHVARVQQMARKSRFVGESSRRSAKKA
jgi:toxin ParE1/3/4